MGKTSEADNKVREVNNADKNFEPVRVLELKGDILLKIDEAKNSNAALQNY